MSVGANEVQEITTLVWESVLEMQVDPADDAGSRLASDGPDTIGAQVRITGAWEGRVALQCSPTLARALTATLFMVDDGEVDGEQLQDAMGELTNMIGGNIKALLPQPSKLSLPEVLGDSCANPDADPIGFECNGQPLIVVVEAD